MFDKAAGSAEDQLGRMLDAARIVRSPIVRAVLGSAADRKGGIDKHIESLVGVLKNMRSRILDAGVKVAIETTPATCRPGTQNARRRWRHRHRRRLPRLGKPGLDR